MLRWTSKSVVYGQSSGVPESWGGASGGKTQSLRRRCPGTGHDWLEMVTASQVVDMPCITSDYFPTILDVLGYQLPEAETKHYDGLSLQRENIST